MLDLGMLKPVWAEEPQLRVRGRIECRGLKVVLADNTPGRFQGAVADEHRLLMHLSGPAQVECRCADLVSTRLKVRGDIDMIPARAQAEWLDHDPASTLSIWIANRLMAEAADALGARLDRLNFAPRLQDQDAQVFQIGLLLATAIESGEPLEGLYIESLATALAVRTVKLYAGVRQPMPKPALSRKRLNLTLDYIEAHLEEDLSLEALAKLANLSVSHFRASFRRATGQSVHQYVIERRVEHAKRLIESGRVSIAEAALASGFCHQSHLARRMREVMGVSPSELKRSGPETLTGN